MEEWQSASINMLELSKIPPGDGLEYWSLIKMKEKGVPIAGNLNLRLDPGYEYRSSYDFQNDAYVIGWRKKLAQAGG